MRRFALVLACTVSTAAIAAPAETQTGRFEYDPADETVHAAMVADEHGYEPHVVAVGDRLWLTWLELEPGKGDRIWVGCRDAKGGDWLSRRVIMSEPGVIKNPTLTPDKAGGLWLSFERQDGESWSVLAMRLRLAGDTAAPLATSPEGGPAMTGVGSGINHRTASDPKDGIWVVWQAVDGDRFGVRVSRITRLGVQSTEAPAELARADAWHPDIAVVFDGDVYVVFDACTSEQHGFDTYMAWRHEGRWSPVHILNSTDAFETRARVASDAAGRVWTMWEEGNRNWGGSYRSRMRKLAPDYLEMTDEHGPLHAYRWFRVNMLIGAGRSPVDPPLPMPAFEKVLHRPNAPKGVMQLGTFYERGELAADGLGRLWVVYRHYYVPWLGVEKVSHRQQDWGVYARCFDGTGWSKLFRCDIGQGDGMQRLTVTGLADGIALVYATGRTDRRPSDSPVNIALATIHLSGESAVTESSGTVPELTMLLYEAAPVPRRPEPGYQLFFGDLHRHTDLSLCDVPADGTIDDAYRYAIDVAKLDFLGITDHSRDIAEGNVNSLLWWRCRKEVSRHTLARRFIAMYSYEHSRGGEDHNVVSLHPNLLRPDTMPFPKLWSQLDGDTFTIPHQTICNPIPASGEIPLGIDGKTWEYGDNAHRPLIEVYQGCRDRVIDRDAHAGLAKGHIMGFIASSDHMSTAASYAGVWAEHCSRESIFRAMQARRTFGATDKIRLRVTMGSHWMGEQVPAADTGPVHVTVEGTAAIQSLDLVVDGRVSQSSPQAKSAVELDLKLPPFVASQATRGGIHYFYVRLKQVDGNMAWSSPMWVGN